MAKMRIVPAILLFALIIVAGRESQAAIYKYMNEKGVTVFTDDMQKIPEQLRASAVIVSGVVVDEKAEEEKTRQAAEARIRREHIAMPAQTVEPVSARLVRSGIALGIFIAVMFVISNIHGLQGHTQVLSRVRITLILLVLAFLGYTHAKDVMGLFGKVGDTVSNPIADIQDRSAERGKKAAEAYKTLEKALEQQTQDEEARQREIERKFDDAERGK
jgi:hypothetical protein